MRLIRSALIWSVVAVATGCALSPGMNTIDLQRQGGVVTDANGEPVTVAIKPIDAALIVEMRGKASSAKDQQLAEDNEVTTTTLDASQDPWSQSVDSQAIEAGLIESSSSERDTPSSSFDDYVYRVGPADILSIIVWDHPELTIPAGAERSAEQAGTVVENDGTIYFPYAGVVQVENKTLPEIRSLLTSKLGDYIEEVKLDVRMAEYNNKRVYVVGEVRVPSIRTISNIPPTIIEMINAAGGFTEDADTQLVTLTRSGETFSVDLLALYENGDASQNLLLQPGDVVNVWDKSLNKVYVLGEVNQPGSYYVNKGRKSLAEALSEAGGVNPNTSNPGQVFVFRQSNKSGQPDIFHLDASSPDALLLADQFPLQSRDLIYVDAANIVRWSRVIQNISGTMSTLNSASQTNFPLFKGER